ncbi:MAG: PilT/PilU family type 4a pilus ATPase [Planctomycetes bacterium]|nr:PilT/PilU family type 4a pilus ATPase [Planctomycetota bacterium]MCP4838816.1 PilT/PilU family type 4a pilus ATPase [Planctomycetota bacterium]
MNDHLDMDRLLLGMAEYEASDLHIKPGSPPVYRIASKLQPIQAPPLTKEETRTMLYTIIPPEQMVVLEDSGGIDFSYHTRKGDRFRCSIFQSGGAVHAAIRRVQPTIPSFKDLHLPPVYHDITDKTHEGLVIVCGVTGSGKSSTLAAMIDHINHNRHCNIITIEDPVEFVFKPARSYISQREIGIDVPNFPTALRSAVRQDPDILMIGELRDRETMLAGIQAAETGHLVFCTLHTADTTQAFARILEFFPTTDHAFIRSSLAVGLKAIMAQRLLPCDRKDVQRVPATEVLISTPTAVDCIREGHEEDLTAVLASNQELGMHDFTTSLAHLVETDFVDLKVAEQYAPNREALRSRVRGIEVRADLLIGKHTSSH